MKRDITRNNISMKFAELLEKKSIDHITIREIVDLADVNRQTFYYHFKDIYDLMEWALLHWSEKCLQNLEDNSLENRITTLFRFYYPHKIQIMNAYNQSHRRLYENALRNILTVRISARIKELDQDEKLTEDKKELLANTYSIMATSVILDWVESGMPDENQMQLEDLCALMKEMVGSGVKLFTKKK